MKLSKAIAYATLTLCMITCIFGATELILRLLNIQTIREICVLIICALCILTVVFYDIGKHK